MSVNQKANAEILSVGKIIIDIIKADLAGEEVSLPADVDFGKLYHLANMHRVVPLIADAVIRCSFAPDEIKSKFKKELFRVSMRYEAQLKEKAELTRAFSQQGIRHCFLKGQKLSRFYKKPELRFMLDMDVWVDGERIEDAQAILEERGYEKNSIADDKDIGYIKKPFLNVEIHKELKYDYDKGYDYYKGAFSRLKGQEGTCELNMTDEDFYVYILSHSAHHFATAGTGIKNVLDHFYLKKSLKPRCDEKLLTQGLNATGLMVFNEKMDSLSEYWFGSGDADSDTEEMAEYVMLSGVFGNQTNYYLGGILRGAYGEKKSSFILSRLFPPRKMVQDRYPVLKKLPFLLPVIWIVRIISALFSKKDYSAEIESADAVSQEEKKAFSEFISKNGL